MLWHQDLGISHQNPTHTLNTHCNWFDSINLPLIPCFHGFPSCKKLAPGHFQSPNWPYYHLREILPSSTSGFYSWFTRKPSALFPSKFIRQIPLWVLFTQSRQGLYSLEPSVHKCRMNRRGGQTDIRLQCKKEVLKSRRERSWAAHLVADRLVLEPRLVQDLLQLLVVEAGHPDRLGQSYILTLLQGLGGRGGEQSF